MKVANLGAVNGWERWVTWKQNRRVLVLWLRTEGRDAVGHEIPLGPVLARLGVGPDVVIGAMTQARALEAAKLDTLDGEHGPGRPRKRRKA